MVSEGILWDNSRKNENYVIIFSTSKMNMLYLIKKNVATDYKQYNFFYSTNKLSNN